MPVLELGGEVVSVAGGDLIRWSLVGDVAASWKLDTDEKHLRQKKVGVGQSEKEVTRLNCRSDAYCLMVQGEMVEYVVLYHFVPCLPI